MSAPMNLSFGWLPVWKSKVMVFQWFSNGFPWVLVAGKFRHHEFQLELAFSMESKSNGFRMVFQLSCNGFGVRDISVPMNVTAGWLSVWRAKVMVSQWYSNDYPMDLVAGKFRYR